ncbi:MAG: hypothetical protein AAFQ40_03240 [Cyanobacteria bacterium J06623_5]
MARRKKTSSAILAKATKRLSGLKSINPKLDFGNGKSVVSFEKEIVHMQSKLQEYNTLLSKADQASNELELLEKKLTDLTARMLSGVAMNYGRNSNEYEMAGGVRTGERKRKRVQPEEPQAAEPAMV